MEQFQIDIPYEKLTNFCQRNKVRRMALFGSVLRPDFGPDSDVDVLVEFEPDARIGWDIVLIEEELGDLLGCAVDLKTQEELSKHIRDKIVNLAQVIYERAR